MSTENTIYDQTEFSFDSEFEEEKVKLVPSYRDKANSQNFTEGLMEALGYDYADSGRTEAAEMERDDVEALVSEYGEIIFPRDQEDLLEAVDEIKEL